MVHSLLSLLSLVSFPHLIRLVSEATWGASERRSVGGLTLSTFTTDRPRNRALAPRGSEWMSDGAAGVGVKEPRNQGAV